MPSPDTCTRPVRVVEQGEFNWFSEEGKRLEAIAGPRPTPEELERLYRGLAARHPDPENRYAALLDYGRSAWPYGALLSDCGGHMPTYTVRFK